MNWVTGNDDDDDVAGDDGGPVITVNCVNDFNRKYKAQALK